LWNSNYVPFRHILFHSWFSVVFVELDFYFMYNVLRDHYLSFFVFFLFIYVGLFCFCFACLLCFPYGRYIICPSIYVIWFTFKLFWPTFETCHCNWRDRVMVFNATCNNISAISWWSVLLVEETGVLGENHRPVASHWQTWSYNVVSSTSRLSGVRTHIFRSGICDGINRCNIFLFMQPFWV
jgi:hypothetical protein